MVKDRKETARATFAKDMSAATTKREKELEDLKVKLDRGRFGNFMREQGTTIGIVALAIVIVGVVIYGFFYNSDETVVVKTN